MKALETNRLSDEILENVTGGTNSQMMDLQKGSQTNNLSGVKEKLMEKNIKAKLYSSKDNDYTDTRTGATLSHTEVMNRLLK